MALAFTGERRRLPAAVELAAYRIVQESLTNTLRHAGPASATVEIRYGDEELDIRVTDDGAGSAPHPGIGGDSSHGSGHGLIGMRERALATGDALLSPSVTRRLIADVVSRPRTRPTPATGPLTAITQREREVLALVGTGLSNDEIAAALHLSPLTAKTHVSRLLTKLGARDRAQLVVTAYETGLVVPGGTTLP